MISISRLTCLLNSSEIAISRYLITVIHYRASIGDCCSSPKELNTSERVRSLLNRTKRLHKGRPPFRGAPLQNALKCTEKETYQAKMKNRAYWHVFSLIGEIELRNLWNPLFLWDRVWLDEKARFSYSCTRFSCALPRPSSSTFYPTLTDENFHQRQPALLSPVLQAKSGWLSMIS